MEVSSSPSGATVKVEPGAFEANTPTVLTLDRKNAPYVLTFQLDGYSTRQFAIGASINEWVWGNILIGGLIGFAVDHSTGAATELSPTKIHVDLRKSGMAGDGQD